MNVMAKSLGRPRAWVVYESMFGNTRNVAFSIAQGVAEAHDMERFEVGDAPDVVPPDVGLVVVGGPTHGFAMSSVDSRLQAADTIDGPVVSSRRGMRDWLEGVTFGPKTNFVLFDTRLNHPRWFWGSAAKRGEMALQHRGVSLATAPEHFFVKFKTAQDGKGLVDGELDRALAWGQKLGTLDAASEVESVTGSRAFAEVF